jgi:hypothetical protein
MRARDGVLQTLAQQQKQIALRLLPRDEADSIGAILLEIRAGACIPDVAGNWVLLTYKASLVTTSRRR